MEKNISFLAIWSLFICLVFTNCERQATHEIFEDISESAPDLSEIVISEVLPDPHKGGVEFIEIYNNSTKVIDLNTLQVASSNSTGKRSKLHPVSVSSSYIYPKTYKLLSKSSEIIEDQYPVPEISALHTMLSFPVLTNSNGAVILFSNEKVIDSLHYEIGMHDAFIKNPKGVSLERVSFQRSTNSPGNFISAAASPGYSTPGYRNSQSENKEANPPNLYLSSKTFSPQKDESLVINFNFKQGGQMTNIYIYNRAGKTVRVLHKNHRLGTIDKALWDGKDDHGGTLPSGVYHLNIEIYDAHGNLTKFREGCIVADQT